MNDKLINLMKVGGEKKYDFHLKIIEEVYNLIVVNSDDKIITVEIGDPESNDLSIMIDDAITKVL